MITFAEVPCPKCGEWRSTLITIVIDPLGKRFSCDCCAFEYDASGKKFPYNRRQAEPR